MFGKASFELSGGSSDGEKIDYTSDEEEEMESDGEYVDKRTGPKVANLILFVVLMGLGLEEEEGKKKPIY